ncbi:hypothetical protein [Longimicrobium sp.]|uniref:hypothetical protein n=1 Tax=Longimicrobium sp. TaxID=2029185 RepID=UPI002BFF857D|nr:hypothetical protein [Longimicrobium sp.]HSU16731.1 hypothetical protein [Longimicrobium sp.]
MRRLLSAAAVLLLAACSGDPAGSGTTDVMVRTDRSEYDRGAIGEVPVTFTVANHTSGPISLLWCGSGAIAELQLLNDGEWMTTSPPFCPSIYSPVEVAPGASAGGVVFAPGPAGTYRLRVQYGAPGFQAARYGVSPIFRVR